MLLLSFVFLFPSSLCRLISLPFLPHLYFHYASENFYNFSPVLAFTYWLTESDKKLDSVPSVGVYTIPEDKKSQCLVLGVRSVFIGCSQDFHLWSAQPSDCCNWTRQHPVSSVFLETE